MTSSWRRVLVSLLVIPGVLVGVAAAVPTPASGQSPSTTSTCASPPFKIGNASGIQWAQPAPGVSKCARTGLSTTAPGSSTLPDPAFRGNPPLLIHGGVVTGTAGTPGELTVTPVYWDPGGVIPAAYKTLINQFIADVANDSGQFTNVFSIVHDYTNSAKAPINYLVHAGAAVTDSTAFPANGCTGGPDAGKIYSDGTKYSRCLTDAQLKTEATNFTAAKTLPNDLAHLYLYYLPKGVETCFSAKNGANGGICTINPGNTKEGFCAYHSFSGTLLYSPMPYPVVDSPVLGLTCSSSAGSNTGPSTKVSDKSDGVNVNTFTGTGTLNVSPTTGTAGFAASGTLGVVTGTKFVPLTYSAKTATSFTGVNNPAAISAVLATGDGVFDGNQTPNANLDADTVISTTSHEVMETITDPTANGWYDTLGLKGEIGDDCNFIYGDSKSFQGVAGGRWNQTINAHHYFLQEEFDNDDWAANHVYGCAQREELVTVTPATGPAGTPVTVSEGSAIYGGAFASGEMIVVRYYVTATTSVVLCTATTTSTGSFSCNGKIPGNAGAAGPHRISTKGSTSKILSGVFFTRT